MAPVALGLAAVVAAGCSKSDKSAPAATPRGQATVKGAFAAWRAAGLDVSKFRPLDKSKLGGSCRAGHVADVAAVLCKYPDAKAAKQAEKKGLELVGDATGASLANKNLLLVVADRHKLDPSGRRINKITKTFRYLK